MLVIIVLAVIVLAGLVARNRLAVVSVRGESMAPTLNPGDRVLLLRTKRLRRGRIVVLEPIGADLQWGTRPLPPPARGEWLVKRVAALPGDLVPDAVARRLSLPEGARVPAGQVVVLGDGAISRDSRSFGFVPADRILGLAIHSLVITS